MVRDDGKGELLNTAQAMKWLGVSESTWHRWKSAGLLPQPVRLPGRPRWRLKDLERWLEQRATKRG
jgi:predicted DNA-binding transcriptional regulator AlpA